MMKKLVTIVALIAGAITAQAGIGETEAQIIKRFGINAMVSRKDIPGATTLEFKRKNYVVIVLDSNHRSIFEMYMLKTGFNKSDANEVVSTVLGGVHWRWTKRDSYGIIRTTDGTYAVLMLPPAFEQYQWGIAVGFTNAVESFNSGLVSQPTPPPQLQPRTQPRVIHGDSNRPPEDCGIIAAQAYAKLKPVASWCQVLSARLYLNGQLMGHAVVAFKYQPDANVEIYDENGSLEIPTTSEDIEPIKQAWQYSLDHASSSPYGKVSVLELRTLTH